MGDYSWIGPLVQAGSTYLGGQQAIDANEQSNSIQRDAYQRALAMLQGGQLDVKAQQAQGVGPSAMANVMGDPAAMLAQKQALDRLQGLSQTGFDSIDRAAMNRAMMEANQNEQSRRLAATAGLNPNSGGALAASLSAQQAGANRANQQGLDIAAESRKRALQALGAFGNLSSTMRHQGFQEAADRAKAQDAISRFNSETSRFNAEQGNQVGLGNVGHRLDALTGAAGAGSRYGQGLFKTGALRANQTTGVGDAIAGGINAANENGDSNNPGYYNDLVGNTGGPADITEEDK